MTKKQIIQKTARYIKERLTGEGSGHDWWHIYRVWQSAQIIGKKEKANMLVVELAALLHDIADWKFNGGNDELGPNLASEFLGKLHVDDDTISAVAEIIRTVSYKGAKVNNKMKTLEGKIVWDADKLDAIGAIGIARVFAYGGSSGRPIHDPDTKPTLHNSFDSYKKISKSGINHFYEKLLLLKDLMYTNTGKKMATKRHKFMEKFLKEFFLEWKGKK